MKPRFAEQANYWTTTIHPAISQGEITQMLDNFGAEAIMVMSGQSSGKYAWLIRFQWNGKAYRFAFKPLACKIPEKLHTYGKNRRRADEQSKYQMGRVAVNFVKAILTAAEMDPAAIFGFLELPFGDHNGIPHVTSELDIEELTGMLPEINVLSLGSGEDTTYH